MASRPVFVPLGTGGPLVSTRSLEFDWHPGFAPVQKKKNIKSLHRAAAESGLTPLLEVSTKSEHELGQAFSAFRLHVIHEEGGRVTLESTYQGSKVFERGGPFVDLYSSSPKEARRDPRLRESGPLSSFQFEGFSWPLDPTFAFYDWLFIRAVLDSQLDPALLDEFAGFTDIEFNPKKSLNTQAHAAALVQALFVRGDLWTAAKSPKDFLEMLGGGSPNHKSARQGDLFDL